MGGPEGWANLAGHSQQSVKVFGLIVFHIANIPANLQLLANSYGFCRDFLLPGLGQAVDDKRRG